MLSSEILRPLDALHDVGSDAEYPATPNTRKKRLIVMSGLNREATPVSSKFSKMVFPTATSGTTVRSMKNKKTISRSMTFMGKFTLVTEDKTNLSIATALMVLERKDNISEREFVRNEFIPLLREKLVNKYFRFRCKVKDYKYFEEVENLDIEKQIRFINLKDFEKSKFDEIEPIIINDTDSDDDGDDHDDDDGNDGNGADGADGADQQNVSDDHKDKVEHNRSDNESDNEKDDEDTVLRNCISSLQNQPLDLKRPLWEWVVIEGYSKGIALFLRVHHSLGDGTSLGIVFTNLCDDAPKLEEKKAKGWLGWLFSLPIFIVTKLLFIFWLLLGLFRVYLKWILEVFRGKDPPTCFAGTVTTKKRVAWTHDLPVEKCKEIGKACGATLNDVMLSLAAGAMDKYREKHGEDKDDAKNKKDIRIGIPVNVRTSMAQMKKIGNIFGFMITRLPLGERDSMKRLKIIKQRMDYNKSIPEPFIAYYSSIVVELLPQFIVRTAFAMLGKFMTCVMTNVRGPDVELKMSQRNVMDVIGFVPPPTGVGFGMMVLSYADRIGFSVVSDEELIKDPETFIRYFQEEFKQMYLMTTKKQE